MTTRFSFHPCLLVSARAVPPEPVAAGPPGVHVLAEAVDAPLAVAALGAVHGRALLRLAHVRRVRVRAPQVRAGVAQLEEGRDGSSKNYLISSLSFYLVTFVLAFHLSLFHTVSISYLHPKA